MGTQPVVRLSSLAGPACSSTTKGDSFSSMNELALSVCRLVWRLVGWKLLFYVS